MLGLSLPLVRVLTVGGDHVCSLDKDILCHLSRWTGVVVVCTLSAPPLLPLSSHEVANETDCCVRSKAAIKENTIVHLGFEDLRCAMLAGIYIQQINNYP